MIQMNLLGAGGGVIDTQTVTVGYKHTGSDDAWGYRSGSMGSISDGTFNPKGGATITELYYGTSFPLAFVSFTLNGSQTNDGWDAMTIAGTTYTRASATFSNSSTTSWTWLVASNPFGTTVGATVVATFT